MKEKICANDMPIRANASLRIFYCLKTFTNTMTGRQANTPLIPDNCPAIIPNQLTEYSSALDNTGISIRRYRPLNSGIFLSADKITTVIYSAENISAFRSGIRRIAEIFPRRKNHLYGIETLLNND